MSFLILLYIAVLVFLTLARYSRFTQVLLAMIFLFGLTSFLLFQGLTVYATSPQMSVFGKDLAKGVFLILMTVWYGVDIFCSVLIVRNYRLYLLVNSR